MPLQAQCPIVFPRVWWKRLLPLAAGTGREKEQERITIIITWLWESVLPTIQPFADLKGFGKEWQAMLNTRYPEAARAACTARASRAVRAICDTSDIANIARAVDHAVEAANVAAEAAVSGAEIPGTIAWTVELAIEAALSVDAVWANFDPYTLLNKLIHLEH